MSAVTEDWARSILLAAISEQRCAQLLNTLFDGGSVTIDARSGRLAFASASQLALLWGDDE